MVSKVRVFGKAQNRTVLGIVNAYMVVYPHATLADLDKAFPASLNSALKQFNLTSNFLTKEIIASRDADKMKCHFDDSPITLGDGKVVYLFSMWQKNDFERTVAFAEQYAIEVAEFKPIDGYRKGGYTLEYLNGFVPEVPKKKSNMMWIILAIVAVLAICAAIFLSGGKKEIVEVEKIVTVTDTVVVYAEKIQEIQTKFNALQFEVNKYDLSLEAKEVLIEVVYLMKNHPDMQLKVIGHTSDDGAAAANQTLSENRAKSVVDYIVSKGVDASRLASEGKGSSEPIDANNKEVNRRTEFVIIK